MNGTEAEIRVLRLGIIKKQNGWNVNSGLQRKAADIPGENVEWRKRRRDRLGSSTFLENKPGQKYMHKGKVTKKVQNPCSQHVSRRAYRDIITKNNNYPKSLLFIAYR